MALIGAFVSRRYTHCRARRLSVRRPHPAVQLHGVYKQKYLKTRRLVPDFDTAAPPRRQQSVEQYKVEQYKIVREPESARQALRDQPEDCREVEAARDIRRLPTGIQEAKSTVLSIEEEAIIVAFRWHTMLPLDDCLYALQPTVPHLMRLSLHRCIQRQGISRLPEIVGSRPSKKKFKAYPIGYFHIDIAEVKTAEGKLYLYGLRPRAQQCINHDTGGARFGIVEKLDAVAGRDAGALSGRSAVNYLIDFALRYRD